MTGDPHNPPAGPAASQDTVVPLAREQLDVQAEKRPTGRVAVRVTSHEELQAVDLALADEQVDIQRVAMERVVDAPSPVRHEGDVTIVPVYEERLVVEKRLVLKEEIHITRRRAVRQHHEQVAVRYERADISREPAPPSAP